MGIENTIHESNEKLLAPYSRPLVRNAWYCGAWVSEVGENLLARRILDMPIVFYRAQTGEPVAVLDVCPHKLAPMHQGWRLGDDLVCGYHGLQFDKTGACVHNPQGNGIIPPHARLRSFPVAERYGAVWIWMGDPAKADAAAIPDFGHIDDAGRRTVRGGHIVASNYMMMVENLMDLGHVLYLHGQTAGAGGLVLSDNKIGMDGNSVFDHRLYSDTPPPSIFAKYAGPDWKSSDFWTDINWFAPSMIRNHTGVAPAGEARQASSVDLFGSHFLTPETQDSTHYFYCHSRNFRLDDPEVDEYFHNWQRSALKAEDSRVAEAIARLVPEADALGVRMVVLSTDLAGIRVNRILDGMAAADAENYERK